MSGPLSLLGDVLMQGSRDYMAIRREDELRETARRQQLDDEQRRRGYQLEDERRSRQYFEADRGEARDFEKALYEQRRFDSIVDQLVRDGRISTVDAKDPAKVNEALNKFGVQYRLKVEELAEYKAALPQIMKVVGKVPNAEAILTMTATADTDMAPVRAIMQGAFTALGSKQEDMIKKGERNLEVGAALMAANMATQRGLYSRLEELGAPIPEVEVRRAAEQLASEGKSGGVPSEAEIMAAMPQALKALQGARQVEAYQIQQQLPAVSRQLDVIGDAVRSGTYGFMKDDAIKAATEGGVTYAGKPDAPAQADDNEEVIDFLKDPAVDAKKPEVAQPAAPAPIALGVDDPLGLAFNAAQENEQRLRRADNERSRVARVEELARDIAQLEKEIAAIEDSGGHASVVFGQVVPNTIKGQEVGMFGMRNAPDPAQVQDLARQRAEYRRALQLAKDELALIGRPPSLGI